MKLSAEEFKDLLCCFEAVQFGQVQIHDYELVASLIPLIALLDHIDSLKPPKHQVAPELILLKDSYQSHSRIQVVLDNHDLSRELFVHVTKANRVFRHIKYIFRNFANLIILVG